MLTKHAVVLVRILLLQYIAGMHGISSFHWAVLVICLLVLPTLFIQSFKRLSWLNLVGFATTLVVTATVIALILADPFREDMPQASDYALDTQRTCGAS